MADEPDYSFDAVQALPYDPFRPIVTLTPIAGFPSTIQVPTDTDQGDVTLNLTDRLQHFELTDNDRQLDKCVITFVDEEGLFTDPNRLLHGAVIDIAWGYPGGMSQKRRLIIRKIKLGLMQGRKFARRRRGFLVTFTALAPGIITHSVAPTTTDVFEGRSLSSVVLEVTERMGYSTEANGDNKVIVSVPSDYDIVRDSITRAASETYEHFLMRLADEHGLLYRKNGQHGVYFGPRKTEDTAQFTIDQDGNNLMGFDLEGDLIFGIPVGLTIAGMRPADQKVLIATASAATSKTKKGNTQPIAHTKEDAQTASAPDTSSGQVEEVDSQVVVGTSALSGVSALSKSHTVYEDFRPVTSDKMAAKMARFYNERIKKTWRLRVKIVGNVNVVAGSTISMLNFQTALLDGLWYVKEVHHTIDQSGYVTDMTCRRETSRNATATKAGVEPTSPSTAGKKGGAPEPVESMVIIGTGVGGTSKTKTKTGRNAHSTDGEFFNTTTRKHR
jgi:uncharacterized protein